MTKREIYSNIINGLERERTVRNLTQEKMAEYLGISRSTYRQIVDNASNKIDFYTAYKASQLSDNFLCEMVKIDTGIPFISDLKSLSPRQLKFIQGIVTIEKEMKDTYGDTAIPLITPTGDMKDGMLCDSMNIESLKIDTKLATCAVKVTSNHLHPVYHKGDILLVRQEPPRNGDVGIFINKEDGCIYIRKFIQTDPCRLEPINNYGQTFLVAQDDEAEMNKWIKFGWVVKRMR